MRNLPPHIRKWWDVANDRRQRLIVKNSKAEFGEGPKLSKDQAVELTLLQAIADLIITHYGAVPKLPDMHPKLEEELRKRGIL